MLCNEKEQRRNPPKKHPKQAKKGPRAPQTKGKKRAPPKKGPGEPIFLGEGGGVLGLFFWRGRAQNKGPKEGPTTSTPPFIIIKREKRPPPKKKMKKNSPPPPKEKGKKGPRTKKALQKNKKGPKKEGSKARRAREAANPPGEIRKSTLPLHN